MQNFGQNALSSTLKQNTFLFHLYQFYFLSSSSTFWQYFTHTDTQFTSNKGGDNFQSRRRWPAAVRYGLFDGTQYKKESDTKIQSVSVKLWFIPCVYNLCKFYLDLAIMSELNYAPVVNDTMHDSMQTCRNADSIADKQLVIKVG